MKTLIVIVGPTGVGKTALCLDLAQRLDTVIINADSRQIYKEIPIGTAAPTKEEQDRVKHFFVGNLHIGDYYNDGIDNIPNVNDDVRKHVKADYEKYGLAAMCRLLERLDPEYYAIVDKNNPKRVIHAVEICISTGKTYTSFRTNTKKKRPFNIIKIGLIRERDELYRRIDMRVDNMVEAGLVDEATRMYPHKELNALNTVGYKELFSHFDGKCSLSEAIFRIKCDTHKYCRKQLTWFKRDNNIKWFSPDNVEEIINYVTTFR